MKTPLKLVAILAGLLVMAIILMAAVMPWMDRWGASDAEIASSLTGDELVPNPRVAYTRALMIDAAPEHIYPWIAQLGAERGGMYSYTWFETNVLRCELINADRIHTEWQDVRTGDKVKMCPGESGPPPYEVAALEPGRAFVLGHQDGGEWSDVWQFILVPQVDGRTRLILRSRDAKSGFIWDLLRPGEFVMARGMLLGIRERAEKLAAAGGLATLPQQTPTPEIFIPLDEAIPDYGLSLEGVHLDLSSATLADAFPAGCSGEAPACTAAGPGNSILSVTFVPRDLPEGEMLAYKSVPEVWIAMETGRQAPCTLRAYDNASHTLTLGCEVPEDGAPFGLHWADLAEIPLDIHD